MLSLLFVPFFCSLVTAAPSTASSNTPLNVAFLRCTPRQTSRVILPPSRETAFHWEGQFHQDDVGYNTANGMSYDGTLLNGITGVATEKHPFSAASKESLQVTVQPMQLP